jgi:rare lipoprotein A (peptidoglycan hydrolase)
VRWRPRGLGVYRVRAYGLHDGRVRASISPARRVTAYRAAAASYYGPGLYGGALACGGTLQPGTLGVANKTLPCGSKVRLRYRGRSVTVPVVDRGPYVAGRDFDLTAATRARLRFPSTGVLLSSR